MGADIGEIAERLGVVEKDLVHVDLPMGDAAIEQATDALLAAGFVFGLAARFGPATTCCDSSASGHSGPGADRPNLLSEGASTIMQIIEADAQLGVGRD